LYDTLHPTVYRTPSKSSLNVTFMGTVSIHIANGKCHQSEFTQNSIHTKSWMHVKNSVPYTKSAILLPYGKWIFLALKTLNHFKMMTVNCHS
jgi:hypothetical protein